MIEFITVVRKGDVAEKTWDTLRAVTHGQLEATVLVTTAGVAETVNHMQAIRTHRLREYYRRTAVGVESGPWHALPGYRPKTTDTNLCLAWESRNVGFVPVYLHEVPLDPANATVGQYGTTSFLLTTRDLLAKGLTQPDESGVPEFCRLILDRMAQLEAT